MIKIEQDEKFQKYNDKSSIPQSNQIQEQLKEAKQRIITFEMIAMNKFTIKQNFYMADTIVSIAKKQGGVYNPEKREWIMHMKKYKETAEEIIRYWESKKLKSE
jgi:galactitol-specific phosphotransferase system IIB component